MKLVLRTFASALHLIPSPHFLSPLTRGLLCAAGGKTPWAGGTYTLKLTFTDDFPSQPPVVKFDPPLFHPNVYPCGKVCLSILNMEGGWKASITVLMILVGIQDLLQHPNLADPAQRAAFVLARDDPAAYRTRVLEEAVKYAT